MSNERGVTMIALSIAIIILSILAGVSIKLGLASNSAVLQETKKETEMQEEMIEEEQSKRENAIQKFEDEWGL